MKAIFLQLFSIGLIFPCIITSTWGQLDSVFYISPLNCNIYTSNAKQFLYLSTPEISPFQVIIRDGAGTILAMPTISKTSPFQYAFGTGDNTKMMVNTDWLNNVISDKGVKVTGSKKFFCDFRVDAGDHAGMLTSKGRTALGTTFRLGNLPQIDDGAHFASVMATVNNTIVTFSNFAPGIKLREGGSSFTPPSSISVTLDAGECYVIAMYNM